MPLPMQGGGGGLLRHFKAAQKELERGARIITSVGDHVLRIQVDQQFAELEIRVRTTGLVGGES
jgi:hypothetical protein